MPSKRLRKWDRQHQLAKLQKPMTVERKSIPADDAFWRAWHDDPKGMREAGFIVTKTDSGWKVSLNIARFG